MDVANRFSCCWLLRMMNAGVYKEVWNKNMSYSRFFTDVEQVTNQMRNYSLEPRPFSIAFCGIFSAGKSSILNALMNCGNLLPTGINPVTKVVTRIQYGEQLSVCCRTDDKIISISEKSINAVITGNQPLPQGCRELLVKIPSKILQNDVELIDTPGYEDNPELDKISKAAVLTADMIVFCCNATMVGKQFEKEYLSELCQTHGNFCMVVNRSDCLNTNEDFQAIKGMAEYLMHEKGNAAHPERQQGKYFMTAAVGPYASLGGFDKYIKNILENEVERKRIRTSTRRCFFRYRKAQLLQEIQEEVLQLKSQLSALQQAENARNDRMRQQKQMNLVMLNNRLEDAGIYGSTLVQSKKNFLAHKIQALHDELSFVEDVSNLVETETKDMIALLARYASDNEIMPEKNVSDVMKQYLQNGCIVPKPVFRYVQRRGFLGRIVTTVIDTIETGVFLPDDGQEREANDYKMLAIEKVYQYLDDFLQRWNILLEDFKKQEYAKKTINSSDPQIIRLQNELSQLKELEQKLL